jgi:Protein of unknown function (DUF732)
MPISTPPRTVRALAVSAAFLAAATMSPARAGADTNGDFLSQLSAAGIGYQNPVDTVALGQSICPMLVEPGKSFASAVTKVRNNGVSPEMAAFFAGIAIQMYCPSMISSVADGSVLNQLGGLNGLTGVSALSGLNAFRIPGL